MFQLPRRRRLEEGACSYNYHKSITEHEEVWRYARMELWNKARSFAEEAAKRSQDLSLGAHKFSEIIAETTKEIAGQASKHFSEPDVDLDLNLNLESFGITDELREFVKGITVTTFRDFPLQGSFLCFYYWWGLGLGLGLYYMQVFQFTQCPIIGLNTSINSNILVCERE